MKNVDNNELNELSELFKIFSNTTRLAIMNSLYEKEKCVLDIANELSMTHSAISHQLSLLKKNRLIKSRRDGKTVYYSLLDSHVLTIIEQGLIHIREK
ncbi:ArsR family transcriptional regulator [Acetitomaculum ruminis DSM 5522]|uniref:ArsR family transcriptional regulator n=1 Tax=Acetitomaculum ruminis DSM 5522 TaxID=1120918 RepID=A0A1I0XPH2_9FIRM|nr:metalloregulator ArsR/SmtB family transcription factor [Acetitomaculum ruminis]SFB02088.1 ArsR family transcriptional regulator [Acetitomaculum ruminis DSM 5522]